MAALVKEEKTKKKNKKQQPEHACLERVKIGAIPSQKVGTFPDCL